LRGLHPFWSGPKQSRGPGSDTHAAAVGDDFERILEYLFRYDVRNPASRLEELVEAIDILKSSPMIGRPLPSGLRELIVGRGS